MILLPFLLLGLVSRLASALDYVTPYTDNIIFKAPSSYIVPRTLYARTLLLSCPTNRGNDPDENVLLATWENYSPEPPQVWFPVYRSTDLGQTWAQISNVTDDVNGWGMRYQPFLYELQEPIGKFPAGTILAAGNSIPTDLSQTQIDVYASLDKGYTWKFVSHVAAGGAAIPTNGETPVWEPFILTYKHQLVLYYSDQRDPDHGQKLVHQVTNNLIHWGPLVDDVADELYDDRPGMTTIAKLPNGKYIITYEYHGAPANLAAYYRISDSPLTFQSEEGYNIQATTGEQTKSSPFVVWTPHGGTNGTIVVSANSHSGLFLNTELGAPGSPWIYLASNATRGYARDLRVLPSNNQILMTCGGSLGGSSNAVRATVLEL
ncbi:BNR/Asp-box repeat protein, partial [Flagelloscypha sp. PMI_526]